VQSDGRKRTAVGWWTGWESLHSVEPTHACTQSVSLTAGEAHNM
jgi:hypothetical protein